MKIFDANISGSLNVSGAAHFFGDLTVDGVINATISGTTSNALTLNTTGSARFATTGSNTFNANQTITGSLYVTNDVVINGTSYTASTSGTSGTSGSNGSSGTSGSSGSDGTSGTSGSSGSNGSSGTAGTSGSSGTVTLTGTQDNGLLTLNGSSPDVSVESNLTYDGSLFNINSNTTITGSLTVTENLNVLGSSSITYTTASQLRVNDNVITVNTSSPGVRFGGLSVMDSGSLHTGSLFWDSLNDRWIYQQASGSSYTGGIIMSGPRNSGALGSETTLTNNKVAKSAGGDHLNDSNITDDGTTIGMGTTTNVTGSLYITTALGVGTNTPTTAGLIRATNDVIAYYSSDERLKENFENIPNSLDKLKQINGYSFDWIPMEGIHENEGHDIGVKAQEIELVLPELVTTRENGYKAVKYEKLVALLIETNKELLNRIEALEAKIK